jgi:hypothetical protein
MPASRVRLAASSPPPEVVPAARRAVRAVAPSAAAQARRVLRAKLLVALAVVERRVAPALPRRVTEACSETLVRERLKEA